MPTWPIKKSAQHTLHLMWVRTSWYMDIYPYIISKWGFHDTWIFMHTPYLCEDFMIHGYLSIHHIRVRISWYMDIYPYTISEWGFHDTWTFIHTPYQRDDFMTHGYLCMHSSLSICCMSFWIFLLGALGADRQCSSAFLFNTVSLTANELKKGNCVPPGSDGLSIRKWTQHYDRLACSECKSWLAMAQPLGNASCWPTLSCAQGTHTHGHENEHFKLFYLSFLK